MMIYFNDVYCDVNFLRNFLNFLNFCEIKHNPIGDRQLKRGLIKICNLQKKTLLKQNLKTMTDNFIDIKIEFN